MFKKFDSPHMRQYGVLILANLSILSTGMNLGWPSPVLVKLTDSTNPVLYRPITELEGSWIVSIGFLCGVIFNFLPAVLLDRIGRKYSVMAAAAPKLAVGFLYIFANEPWMLLLGRAILGISDAFVFLVVPVYASEIASTNIRGSLGTILQIMCSLGIVVMLTVGPFTSFVVLNAIFAAVVVLAFAPLLFIPESPYFLYSKGRIEEAHKVLTFLRGSETLASEEIKQYSSSESQDQVSKKDIVKNRIFLKAFAMVAVLGIGMQLIGFNAVSFYLQTILESTQSSVSPQIASVVIGLIQLAASTCTAAVTDRFGRKPILIVTLIGMMVGMIGLGTFFKVTEDKETISGALNYLPLISLILVVLGYSSGLGSVYWALSAELFDSSARSFGLSLATPVMIFFIFLTTMFFAPISSAIGPAATYWTFGGNCFVLCAFIFFFVPETKGRTFAEIQTLLGAKSNLDDKEAAKEAQANGK